ncbi:MAG: hypothetical protein HC846_05780 [Blastocatellia bacterium]|nr:hypothetical protein [Blastocatellia bacterium]
MKRKIFTLILPSIFCLIWVETIFASEGGGHGASPLVLIGLAVILLMANFSANFSNISDSHRFWAS